MTLPLVVLTAAALGLAIDPPAAPPAEVPVTGTVPDPCTGEILTFTGTAFVEARSSPDGAGGFHVRLQIDLDDTRGAGEAGFQYRMAGAIRGKREVSEPFPAGVEIAGNGNLASPESGDNLAARTRLSVRVDQDGSVTPTRAVEIVALECRR